MDLVWILMQTDELSFLGSLGNGDYKGLLLAISGMVMVM